MKKYRLKQWYPSLDVTLNVGDVIELTGHARMSAGAIIYEFKQTTGDYTDVGFIQECEFNHIDFWELLEEPLFVTEDGADVCRGVKTWAVDINTFKKAGSGIHNGQAPNYKYFIHESNADEYILLNKPFLSINDISDLIDINEESIDIDTDIYDKLKQLAKGRSKQ